MPQTLVLVAIVWRPKYSACVPLTPDGIRQQLVHYVCCIRELVRCNVARAETVPMRGTGPTDGIPPLLLRRVDLESAMEAEWPSVPAGIPWHDLPLDAVREMDVVAQGAWALIIRGPREVRDWQDRTRIRPASLYGQVTSRNIQELLHRDWRTLCIAQDTACERIAVRLGWRG